MKHFVERLRPVFDQGRYCGALLVTAKGYAAHNVGGDRIGYFQDPEAAVTRLRAMAARQSK